ncbi:MAG: IclR family transcriptional regulator [Cloacibacillus evryensis]
MEMSAIDKAVTLLEILAASKEEMSIRELEKQSNISKSTIHRVLQNLQQRSWVAQNTETERYNIGLRFLFLYNTDSFYRHFLDVARPLMDRLVSATGQTALISVLDKLEGHCIFTKTPPTLLQYAAYPGMRFPIYAGAPEKFAGSRPTISGRRSSMTTSPGRAEYDHRRTALARGRKRCDGYAFSTKGAPESDVGSHVPILTANGELIAQFGIAGPAADFENKFESMLEEVQKAAKAFSDALNARTA